MLQRNRSQELFQESLLVHVSFFLQIISFFFLASLRLSPGTGRKELKKSAVSDLTKEVVKELSKKKKRKAEQGENRKAKKKKVDKARSKQRSPSPVVDDDTIKEWQEKTKSKKKVKQVEELSEFDKMKQKALAVLAPYTTPEYPFNPLLIGDPDPLVGSRGYYEYHTENIMKQMVVNTRFFKKGTTTNLFWNVSSLPFQLITLVLGAKCYSGWLDKRS